MRDVLDTKISLESQNPLGERLKALRELIPEAFTEEQIDFDKLRSALGDVVETQAERYGLTWAGKSEAIRAVQIPSKGTLEPMPDESVNFDESQNVIIEGDNLEVLKLLQKSYYGKVKMIYIDPPYNTGNEFIYPDNFCEGLEDYLVYSGQRSNDGTRQTSSEERAGRKHSKWLNMMYPRLFLARNLLKEDGVVFVSIDENEVHNLRQLLNEVFGEENFLTEIVVKVRHEKRILKGDKDFHETCEYCLVYTRGHEYRQSKIQVDNSSIDKYVYTISVSGEAVEHLICDDKQVKVYSPSNFTIVKHEEPSSDFLQSISIRGSLKEGNSSGRFYMKHLNSIVENFGYLYEVPGMGNDQFSSRFFMRPPTPEHVNGIYFQGVPLDKSDTKEVPFPNYLDLVKEFNVVGSEGDVEFRNGKKPIAFLKRLLEIAGVNESNDALVLDFFAGSGSMGHAVLENNIDQSTNSRFLLVQLPEKLSQDITRQKASYDFCIDNGLEPNIAAIMKERMRRVTSKIDSTKRGDFGFKTFSLKPSNFKFWDGDNVPQDVAALEQQLELFAANVTGQAEPSVLFELVLKSGFPLTARLERLELGGPVYAVEGKALYICLANPITQEILSAVAEAKPERFICLDVAFSSNDELKTNTVLQLRNAGIAFQTA